MTGRIAPRAGQAGMVLVALVLAHNLAFLAAYGDSYAVALAAAGHGAAWNTAAAIILALGAALLVAAGWRLHRLGLLARAVPREPLRDRLEPTTFVRHLIRLWTWLSFTTGALFVLQENAERLGAGEPLPGVAVLVDDVTPVTVPIIVAVAFVVALVAALFRWRRDELVARIGARRAPPRLTAGPLRRPLADLLDRRHGSHLEHGPAVRAPPAGTLGPSATIGARRRDQTPGVAARCAAPAR